MLVKHKKVLFFVSAKYCIYKIISDANEDQKWI